MDKKYDRFDFEQQIQKCWMVTDDIREVTDFIAEYPQADFTKDRALNALIGLAEMYELKFNKLWDLFESPIMDIVRENKMLNEECAALREQLGQGAGKDYESGAGTGFGIAAIKPNKKGKK